jgi:glycosyltransferase involved in cell wall biosynthesis
MAQYPEVSVVIPAYNAEAFIDDALRSVQQQDYRPVQVVVVNDGSTDATERRVAAFGPTVVYVTQPSSGGYPGSPRNTGMRGSTGDFICFLDADDVMTPGRIAAQVDFLNRHPQVGAVFSDYRNFTTGGPDRRTHFETCPLLSQQLGRDRRELVLDSDEATALLLQENFGIPSTLMIRRSVLSDVESFPIDFRVGEDFHFYYRVARRYAIGILADVGVLRRLHGSNITANQIRFLENCLASRRDLRRSETNTLNMELLDQYVFERELALARVFGEKRLAPKALLHIFRALKLGRADPRSLFICTRAVARTLAIAIRVKQPSP